MKKVLAISTLMLSMTTLVGCVSGKYRTNSEISAYAGNEAPLKLKIFGKARWTHYQITTSTSYMYYEDVKYKTKNDTLYFKRRAIYGDSVAQKKDYIPTYLIKGDTLESIDWDLKYVKSK